MVRRCGTAALLLATAAGGWLAAQQPPPVRASGADVILTNGKVVTVDDRFSIAQAVAIWRDTESMQILPGGLFNYGMVLHSAGRYDQALAALEESRRMRVGAIGASHPLIGETDRMIGEVLAARGDLEGATERFDRAVRLTRVGFGTDHPRTWFAELSMARHLTRLGRPQDAIAPLQALAAHEGGGSEAPKLRWQARAYLAEARCRLGEQERARRDLDALAGELRVALPDGGIIPREVAELRATCQ